MLHFKVLYKNFLRQDLKIPRDFACVISIGKEFHSFGASEEKTQSPVDHKQVGRTVKRPDE